MGDINKNVNLTFTTKDKASAGLKAISKSMDDVTVSTKNATKEGEKFGANFSKNTSVSASSTNSLTSAFSGLALKAGILGAAIAGVNALLKSSVQYAKESLNAYMESDAATTKLTASLGYRSQALLDNAEAMQKVTTYDDDAIAGAMALSAAFIKDESALKKINKAAMDFASARGIDLAQATDLITKSVVSGTNALGRYGIQMSKSGDESVRLASLLKSIENSYGGMAEAMAKTDSGKITQLNNEYENIQETIGQKLMPGLIAWKKVQNEILELALLTPIEAWENTANNLERIYNKVSKGIRGAGTDLIQLDKQLQKMSDEERVPYLDKVLEVNDQKLDKYKKALEEMKAGTRKTYGIFDQKSLTKEISGREYFKEEATKLQDKIVLNQVSKGVQIKAAPIDFEAEEKAQEEFNKKKADTQKSLNEELFKLDQESLSKTLEGKLKALEYSLEKEKEKYKKQYSEGLISLADYYQIATALGDQFFNKKAELIDEEIKLNKELLDKDKKNTEERINNKIEGEQRVQDTLKNIQEQNESNRLSMISSFEDRNQQMMERSMSGRLKLAEQSYLDELTLYKFMLDQKMILQEEYDSMAQDMKIEFNETQYDITTEELNKWVSATTQAASQITSVVQQFSSLRTQKEIDDIDAQTEANKESAQKYIKNKKLLDKELKKIDKEAEARKKEAAKGEQKLAMIASIINTAQAVSGALTMKPPPLGIAMAIIVGALGAVQTGIIASQAFAQGGIIQPEQGVPTTGDKTRVSANPGEMIINQRQQRNLLAMANGYGGGGGISINETIIVQGNMDSNAIAELKQHREEWLEMLRDSNKQLKYRGYTYAQ